MRVKWRVFGALLAVAALAGGCGGADNAESVKVDADAPVERRAATHPVVATDEATMRARHAAGVELFRYDRSSSLDVRLDESFRGQGLTGRDLTYASPKGGRVPATLLAPDGDGPFAGLVMLSGLGDRRQTLLSQGEDFARSGAVVLLVDAPFARPQNDRPDPITFTERDRAEQIQLIVDLRRAVDLLAARDDVDPDRIGFFGFSYGAAMGGLLAGVEKRIAAHVLASGDGGLVEHFTGADDSDGRLAKLSPARRKRWLRAMEPIEPLYYVGQSAAPVLFQAGRRDELIPRADAARFHEASNELGKVVWYKGGHNLDHDLKARCDRARWLGRHIGIAARSHYACDALRTLS